MVRIEFITLNIIGFIISGFSVYVTYNLYRKYRLNRTIGFIFTAFNILLWNIAHLLYDLIPSDNYNLARATFVMANVSGLFIILGVLFSFSVLRNESLDFKLVIYTFVLSMFVSAILVRSDWMDIVYHSEYESWNAEPFNGLLWNIYSLVIVIFLVIELYYPLAKYFVNNEGENRMMVLYLLILALLGPLSNTLLSLMLSLGLPPVTRYLIANLAFFGIFVIFYEHPFVGIQDKVEVRQILVSNDSGMPVLSSGDLGAAALSAGALHGINTILDEITGATSNFMTDEEESTRKIELSEERFFIIRQGNLISIFQYAQHSGVCIAKFKSLGRVLRPDKKELNQRMNDFINSFKEYFPNYKDLIDATMITSAIA